MTVYHEVKKKHEDHEVTLYRILFVILRSLRDFVRGRRRQTFEKNASIGARCKISLSRSSIL